MGSYRVTGIKVDKTITPVTKTSSTSGSWTRTAITSVNSPARVSVFPQLSRLAEKPAPQTVLFGR